MRTPRQLRVQLACLALDPADTCGLRREVAPGKGGDARVSNDALIVCEERLREHVYALIEGEEYDAVSRSW